MAPTTAPEAPHITLSDDCSATLVKPRPFVAMALAKNRAQLQTDNSVAMGVTCAALRLTWPPTRKFPGIPGRPWKLGDSLVEFGAEVFDALFDAGIPVADILEKAGDAYTFALQRLGENEVAAAEDFSEAAPEDGNAE